MADINDTIYDNLGLAYTQLSRFGLTYNPDAESFALEALYKAVITYKPETGNAFSTYAICVISNSLRHYMRSLNKKRQLVVSSYDEPVYYDSEERTMLDTIVGPDTTEEAILAEELRERVAIALDKVYKELTIPSHKRVFECWRDGDFVSRQTELASLTGLSQPYVSRVLSSIKHKLKIELEDYL